MTSQPTRLHERACEEDAVPHVWHDPRARRRLHEHTAPLEVVGRQHDADADEHLHVGDERGCRDVVGDQLVHDQHRA